MGRRSPQLQGSCRWMSMKVPGAVLLPVGVQVRSRGSVVRRRVGCSQSGSRLQEVQSGFGLQVRFFQGSVLLIGLLGFGWRLVLEGRVVRRRRLWALARKKTSLVRDSGKWDASSSPCGFGFLLCQGRSGRSPSSYGARARSRSRLSRISQVTVSR
ncbi:hypothetical protein B0F90DRAFT_1730791 [Multifurca ochricompacta]|uniref:Uncharacterized protein n=1 Tax=Multifurca ochricompacta TaxID=376703 RepID=A0AAD4M405_9AGAM|nr:hypothetical protein B0F90DRAFT_1770489 [Multifurca ochricompacta]KAI0294894.1 hypothetical protein B0F90DRAFT_1753574 [Multifurca ochricompacta]KAI0298759.1 hypothetical protein B0F90DRAFT_1730791 [Multifurca ochricompacta]